MSINLGPPAASTHRQTEVDDDVSVCVDVLLWLLPVTQRLRGYQVRVRLKAARNATTFVVFRTKQHKRCDVIQEAANLVTTEFTTVSIDEMFEEARLRRFKLEHRASDEMIDKRHQRVKVKAPVDHQAPRHA